MAETLRIVDAIQRLAAEIVKPRPGRRRFLKTAVAAAATAPFIARGAEAGAFEIGIAADAQYADIPSTATRFYRKSIARLAEAVEHCNGRDLEFCVHLGDLIDKNWTSFDEISAPLAKSRHRWHQLLGNHDFDVLDAEKPRVPEKLGMKWRHGYFDHGAFRFVILDTNEVSTYATLAGTPERAAAERELARIAAGRLVQAKPWNGGMSGAQLAWFERVCADAGAANRRAIVFAHQPVAPDDQHNLWNATDALAIIERQPAVVAWFNGHNHAGNFAERHGVPFVTIHGMVETPETNAFATARILSDRMILTGHGRVPSRELKFRA